MIEFKTASPPGLHASASTMRQLSAADTLVAAIRRPLDALDGAADEAANGRLGRAKLGLLVAANGLIEAFTAIDAEFARQYRTFTAGPDGLRPDRHGTDTDNVPQTQ